MPGFNAQQIANRVQSGNAVLVQLGDQTVMFAQTVAHSIPMGTEGLYGIGSSKPQEIQQFRFSPQFSLDTFSLTNAGLVALQGGVNLNYLLAGNSFTMTVIDGVTEEPLFVYVGAKCQNFSESLPTNAPVRDAYSFLALDVLDMDGNSLMDTGDNALELAPQASIGVSGSIGVGGVSIDASASITL